MRLAEGSPSRNQGHEASRLVSRIIDYLSHHYREEISLDALAERFFVSKYHLSHQFSQSVGTSVYRYVLLKRLQHARQLLLDGGSPSEACRESGFQDYANFYRSFRSVYGISPQDAARHDNTSQ